MEVRPEHRVGRECLETVTELLQRVRTTHAMFGLFEAAEMHWWWTVPRSTDELAQLFWFDSSRAPVAAAILTDWGGGTSAVYESTTLALIVMPDASSDLVVQVIGAGLAHAAEAGIDAVEIEVGGDDEVTRAELFGRGFTIKEDGLVQCWIDAAKRPPVSPLAPGYRLCSRAETADRAHHMTARRAPGFEDRLADSWLYRPALDLVVLDADDEPAGYGLFWFDPVSRTGVVEPMRTHERHQRRGIGRHILTAGIDRLASAGAERISIGFEPENPASGPLYVSAGFVPHRRTDVFAGPTAQ